MVEAPTRPAIVPVVINVLQHGADDALNVQPAMLVEVLVFRRQKRVDHTFGGIALIGTYIRRSLAYSAMRLPSLARGFASSPAARTSPAPHNPADPWRRTKARRRPPRRRPRTGSCRWRIGSQRIAASASRVCGAVSFAVLVVLPVRLCPWSRSHSVNAVRPLELATLIKNVAIKGSFHKTCQANYWS